MEWEDTEGEEFDLSQTKQRESLEDDEMVDLGDSLEKEKEEMRVIDSIFEEKTKKLDHVLNLQQHEGGGTLQCKGV
jgi:hypothetical protein